MNKVVIGDYYHITTKDQMMNWMKLTHLLPSLYIYLYIRILNSLLDVHTRETNTSPLVYYVH